MEDKIPFNDWSKDKIRKGWKKCTSRHKRYTKDKRVTWISPKLPWWFIRRYLWKREGAGNPSELQQIMNDIYKRQVPNDEEFYVHFGDFSDEVTKQTNRRGE